MAPSFLQKPLRKTICFGFVALFCILLVPLVPSFASSSHRTYTLAVIPQMPPVSMYRSWSPVVDELSKETGYDIRLKVYERMVDFEEDCKKGTPDFIYASPPLTVIARKAQGYEPLLRNSVPVSGVVFVKKDSAIRSIRDLEGKEIVFVGSRNVCSIYIRHALSIQGMNVHVRKRFAGSTQNVFEHVIRGTADAGGTLDMALNRSMASIRDQVRVIYSTPQFAPHPLSAHPRVPDKVRAAIVRALYHMRDNAEGKGMLAAIRFSTPVPADYIRDYGFFEDFDLSQLMAEK